MVDERTQALIDAELEGEISAAERAELERALAGSAEARKLRDDLQRVTAALARLPQQPVPAGLGDAISEALAKAAPRGKVVDLASRRPRQVDSTRLGFALAAGVALGAVGLIAYQQVQGPGPDQVAGIRGVEGADQLAGIRGIDAAEMAGTMVREQVADEVELAVLAIDRPEVKGSATLFEGEGVLVLQFDLESAGPVTVEADYASPSLRLMGFAQGAVEDASITSTAGRVGYINHGGQRFSMYLRRAAPGASQVKLAFRAGGTLVHEAVLEVPAQAGPR